jgi:hypothetical protein
VRYWTNVYTVETWEIAATRGYAFAGFPQPTAGRGGYFHSTFENVAIGDTLLCYVVSPAQRWTGALRVSGPWYLESDDDLWGRTDDGTPAFPARIPTEPLAAVEVDRGLPIQETIPQLRSVHQGNWSGLFRRSLTSVPEADGETLVRMLRKPREPIPVRRKRRRPVEVRQDAAHAESVLTIAQERTDDVADDQRGRVHRELVWNLILLGSRLGCEVWVASDERGREFDGNSFADHVAADFPQVGLDPASSDLVRLIDVLWLRSRQIIAAFEVEATTSVYSGLLRMSDLVALQPNTSIDLYIVAPDARRDRVLNQITRPTFDAFEPPLRDRCRFISATKLAECIKRSEPPLNKYLQPGVIREFAEQAAQII